LALHLLVGAALAGGRVASLTKTDLENSISGYGQGCCKLTKSREKCQCIFACPKTSWWVESTALVLNQRYLSLDEQDLEVRWKPLKIFMLTALD